jgi:hypothetical protein
MSQVAHLELVQKVQTLEEWRALTVDPMLQEHEEKLNSFQRIEQQIAGVARFFKLAASAVAALATIVEVTRFVLAILHLIR